MLASAYNILAVLNNVVTGDCGVKVDSQIQSAPTTLAATVVTDTDFFWVVPRDYDDQTNELSFRVLAAMGGATDTPALTLTLTRVRDSLALVTDQALGNATQAGLDVVADTNDLVFIPGDVIRVRLGTAAHNTDTLTYQSISASYRSTIAAYNESDRR